MPSEYGKQRLQCGHGGAAKPSPGESPIPAAADGTFAGWRWGAIRRRRRRRRDRVWPSSRAALCIAELCRLHAPRRSSCSRHRNCRLHEEHEPAGDELPCDTSSCGATDSAPSPVGTVWAGQDDSTRDIASCSACVTHSEYFAFTPICRATYEQRNDLLAGSQVAASPSDLRWFDGPSTASRLYGSFASCLRRSAIRMRSSWPR